MQLISAHDGKLLTLNADHSANGPASNERSFSSGLAELDSIAPGGAFACGAIHELLTEPADGYAMFLAMMLAKALMEGMEIGEGTEGIGEGTKGRSDGGTKGVEEGTREENTALLHIPPSLRPSVPSSLHRSVPPSFRPFVPPSLRPFPPKSILIWCDPARDLYPPALAAHGLPLDRLFLLHPRQPDLHGKELLWAMAECLRCKGIGAVVGAVPGLSRIAARRLQLAAETGGGAGILLRHVGRDSRHHAAASRWLIRPAPGGRTIQRWTIQLLHGHGGRIGQTLCLEHCRETNHLHSFDPMADRSPAKKPVAV